jgi:hypothetical protein
MQCSVLVLLVMWQGEMRQKEQMQPQLLRQLQRVQQRQQRSGQLQQQLACRVAAAAAVLHLVCGRLLWYLPAPRLLRCWHPAAMHLALALRQQQQPPSSTSLVAVELLWLEQQQLRLLLCHHPSSSSSSSMGCRLSRLSCQPLQAVALLPGCGLLTLRLQRRAKPVPQQQQQHLWRLKGQQRYSQRPFLQCMGMRVAPAAATAPGGSSSSTWCSMGQRSNLTAAATCMEVSV